MALEHSAESNERVSITLYHASDHIVDIPDIKFPGHRNNCDFGNGFYLTERKQIAEEWVIRNPSPVINVYSLDAQRRDIFYLDGVNWVKTILGFRERVYSVHFKSPIICGPIANDRMNDALPIFMQGIIGDLRLLRCLDFCKLGNQYLFRNSAKNLSFVKSYSLKGLELQRARERHQNRRKNMTAELIGIQRVSLSGERFIEEYLEGGDYFEP